MLKYKISFDKKVFIDQVKLILPYIYPKAKKKVQDASIFTISMLAIGIIILFIGSEVSTLFFAIGIFGVFDLYFKYEKFKNIKDGHIRAVKAYIEKENFHSDGSFDFRDDCVRFSNDFICTWINWNDFEKFAIKKSNLLLVPKINKEDVLVIGEKEITSDEFNKVLKFVKSKIG